jgi:nicotinate-nucleotide adenylyltransferase
MGGTFNPVHYGHLAAAEEVRERLNLGHVLFVPSFLPPHKPEEEIPSAVQRMEMVLLATGSNSRFSVSDIELKRGGRSYTVDTVDALRSSSPGSEFFFITGVDSFLDIRTWHRWEHLLRICTFAVLSRPGYRFSDLAAIDFMNTVEQDLAALDRNEITQADVRAGRFTLSLQRISHYEISSTEIRKRVREGRSIKYHLPESVEQYIITNELYV